MKSRVAVCASSLVIALSPQACTALSVPYKDNFHFPLVLNSSLPRYIVESPFIADI